MLKKQRCVPARVLRLWRLPGRLSFLQHRRLDEKIETTVNALRTLGFKIVLTSGSFDIIHEGHSMYLEAARQFGDFLIVGLDSDEKIRARKGDSRPVVPQMERLRMVTHQRGVGLVTLRDLRVVAGLFMIAGAMMLGGMAMMFGGVFVMLGGFMMMFRGVC